MTCSMPIGRLSDLTTTPIATIRYYEEISLLPLAERGAGGQRLYGPKDRARIEFIRSRRALDYSLKDIRRLLAAKADCAPNRALGCEQLARVTAKIAALRGIAETLQAQIASCDDTCGETASPTCLIVPV